VLPGAKGIAASVRRESARKADRKRNRLGGGGQPRKPLPVNPPVPMGEMSIVRPDSVA